MIRTIFVFMLNLNAVIMFGQTGTVYGKFKNTHKLHLWNPNCPHSSLEIKQDSTYLYVNCDWLKSDTLIGKCVINNNSIVLKNFLSTNKFFFYKRNKLFESKVAMYFNRSHYKKIDFVKKLNKFVSQVINNLIDSNLKYFYLAERAPNLNVREGSINDFNNQLLEMVPADKFVINDVDTIQSYWKKNSINKAEVINYKQQLKKFKKIKTAWNEAEENFRKSLGLNEIEYVKMQSTDSIPKSNKGIVDFLQLKKEEQQIFFIGKPIFNSSGDYALIEFASSMGSMTTTGYTCIFTKANGQWMLLKKINWWAS